MSNALAIAGVTAVIKDLLDNGFIDHKVNDAMGQGVTVSVVAPDAITLGADAPPRLNLFLHQVTPNPGWRNAGLPSRDHGGNRVSNAPLALDLHYLLTAYASADLHAEVLLGYAMQLLHESPVPSRGAIRKALNPPAPPVTGALLPAVYDALRASALADQIEQIKITPSVMSVDEMSKLWTALQSHYRPTALYQATVVLIESDRPARAAMPVLTRGGADPVSGKERGVDLRARTISPYPEITVVEAPKRQIAALAGDAVTFRGHDLAGADHTLVLSNARLGIDRTVAPATSAADDAVVFTMPDTPAGAYAASLSVLRAGEAKPRLTNEVAFAVAPKIETLPASATLDAAKRVTLTPLVSPEILPGQRASLILGSAEAIAAPAGASTTNPSFVFEGLEPGFYWPRLRVDGVDSLLIDRSVTPPAFLGAQIEIKP